MIQTIKKVQSTKKSPQTKRWEVDDDGDDDDDDDTRLSTIQRNYHAQIQSRGQQSNQGEVIRAKGEGNRESKRSKKFVQFDEEEDIEEDDEGIFELQKKQDAYLYQIKSNY